MYQLFSQLYTSSNSVTIPPSFDYIKRTYQQELLKIDTYYNNNVFYAKNTNLLVRLLNTFAIPVSYDLDRFIEIAVARSPYIARHFNFTNELSYGQIFSGEFYNPKGHEIIISYDEYFNPYGVLDNWKTIRAVKVLDHNVSDFGLLLPKGSDSSTDIGLSVIAINIPLLLMQYRGFLLDQQIKASIDSSGLLATNHFVHMYVLPSMLHSHIDLVILNRLINLFHNEENTVSLKRHPFSLSDYSSKTDVVLKDVLKRIKNNNMNYFSLLKNIPAITGEDMQASLLMPDIVKTRQVWWAMTLARLKVIEFILDISDKKGRAANAYQISKLKLQLKWLVNEHIFPKQLPSLIYQDIELRIEKIFKLV